MKKLLVFLCAAMLVFVVAGTAGALIIDFENTPEQYWWDYDFNDWAEENLGDYYPGLSFGDETVIKKPGPFSWWYQAHSGQDVLGTADPTIQIHFDQPTDYVGFYYDTCFGVTVTAYDSVGNEIVQNTANPTWCGYDMDYWSYNSDSFNIAYVTIEDEFHSHFFVIDDLEYNPNPVPEPATVLLLGAGLLGLAGLGRKKFFKKETLVK
jgi:hypothetical protein